MDWVFAARKPRTTGLCKDWAGCFDGGCGGERGCREAWEIAGADTASVEWKIKKMKKINKQNLKISIFLLENVQFWPSFGKYGFERGEWLTAPLKILYLGHFWDFWVFASPFHLKHDFSVFSTFSAFIKWVIQRDIVCIPKSVTPSRIISNSEIFDFTISNEDMSKINGLSRGTKYLYPFNFEKSRFFPFNRETKGAVPTEYDESELKDYEYRGSYWFRYKFQQKLSEKSKNQKKQKKPEKSTFHHVKFIK